MHSFASSDDTLFHFNSDLSGEVTIHVMGKEPLRVPGEDLVEFVAEIVRRRRIEELQVATPEALFGLPEARTSRR